MAQEKVGDTLKQFEDQIKAQQAVQQTNPAAPKFPI